MLAKLLKHDFKSTGKVLIPVNLVLVIVTIAGSILLGTRLLQRTEMIPLAVVLLITYILMLLALSIVTSIFLIVYYYRNMFSAQGYLTFTLPASPWTIFNSKMITGFVWILLNAVLTFSSAMILIGSAGGFSDISSMMDGAFIGEMSVGTETITVSMLELFGYTPIQLIILGIVVLLAASFYSVVVGYGSVTIGQLYAKHKVVGAVLAYFIIYFIVQIISTVNMFLFSFSKMFHMLITNPDVELEGAEFVEMMQSIYRPIIPMSIILYLVVGIICCVASVIIIKKKVNLD